MDKQILTFKELREAKGFTQESLARAVGLSRLAIARYESRQTEPKLGNFLKIARTLKVSLAELALAMGHKVEDEALQVCEDKSAHAPAQNETLAQKKLLVHNGNPEHTPAKRQSQGFEAGDKNVQVYKGKTTFTPAKKREKGKGTGFIEERLIKRGNKQYKQYWFHWQKTKPGKGRVFATSRYIPKRLVAKIIGKNNQKLPVREIVRILGVK